MKILNDLFEESCVANYTKIYKKQDVYLIPNFFKNYQKSFDFFRNLGAWKSNNSYNLGFSILLPDYIVRILLNKFFKSKNLLFDENSFSCECNFWYHGMSHKENSLQDLIGNGVIPHIDYVPNKNELNIKDYVCLINLNQTSITTNFWSFCDKKFIENEKDYLDYFDFIKSNTFDETLILKKFKKEYSIQYEPNTCIVYPSNLFHSPLIDKTYNFDNPRVVLRLSYKSKEAKYFYS